LNALALALGGVVGALALAAVVLLVRVLEAHRHRRILALLAACGVLAAWLTGRLEQALFDATGLSVVVDGRTLGPLLVMLLVVAPLEEASKFLPVWASYRFRRLTGRRSGVLFAVATAAGFALLEGSRALVWAPESWTAVRALVALPAHLFCAGSWGYALGTRVRSGGGAVGLVWCLSTLFHGLYDHIVFGRGPGVIALALPLMLVMGLLGLSVLREIRPGAHGPAHAASGSALPDVPSLRAMRQVLRRSEQPLMIHWIAIGALVNVGVVLVSLAGAVWLGHRLGLDFAAAQDESRIGSNAPLLLLGVAVLAAFPIAGYLVARASGTRSVLEPAMATAVAIVVVVVGLSVTAPVALLFATAIAPVAFGLACGGAWFGVSR
jgi:RsiW-degrading membrane proteinase PrsW (M82 family)